MPNYISGLNAEVGDLIWWNDYTRLGQVVDVNPVDSGEMEGAECGLLISYGILPPNKDLVVFYPQKSFESEGIEKLSKFETDNIFSMIDRCRQFLSDRDFNLIGPLEVFYSGENWEFRFWDLERVNSVKLVLINNWEINLMNDI